MKAITQNGVELAVIEQTTIGRKGAAGSVFVTADFETAIAYKDDNGKRIADDAQTGINLAKFFKGIETAIAFIQSDFDRAMVAAQVRTPANSKTPKTLSLDEKRAVFAAYVATINEETRRRTGIKSEYKRLDKEMKDFMVNPANFADPAKFAATVQDYALRLAKIDKQIQDADNASE